MNLYNCFAKKDQEGKIEDLILIPDNFSWSALFFNSLFFAWFLFHKMWREVIFLFLFLIFIGLLGRLIPFFSGILFQLTIYFFLALNCRIWLGEYLVKRRGYQMIGMVFGKNSTAAKLQAVQEIQNQHQNFTSPFIKPSPFSDKLLNQKN